MIEDVRDLRVPIPRPVAKPLPAEDIPVHPTPVEYLVLELWPDHTVRHPTTGCMVVAEVFERDREWAIDWLRGLVD